ncbi:MAG: DinB family protein [Chloroflexi bacterium]|nr:DinB family protein [Chloroflexota bacterium]
MDPQLERVRNRHLLMLERTLKTLSSVITAADSADLRAKRDGPDGWTPLDIVCHLRDLEPLFISRAQSVIDHDNPTFVTYNVNQLVIDNNYAAQDPAEALAELSASRARTLALFRAVQDDQWARTGIHPAYGLQTLLDVLMHIAHHDLDHIEQMTRVLAQES